MKGIFFVQLQQYIAEHSEPDQWRQILQQADIFERKLYFSTHQYDDEEFFRIIKEAVRILGMSPEKFLNEFGTYVSGNFLKLWQPVIKPEWKTLDLLQHVQEFNFNLLQAGDNPAMSGKFVSKRVDPHTVNIEYSSPRKMCPFFKGLVKGISEIYQENIDIQETNCALKGHPHCHYVVSLKH